MNTNPGTGELTTNNVKARQQIPGGGTFVPTEITWVGYMSAGDYVGLRTFIQTGTLDVAVIRYNQAHVNDAMSPSLSVTRLGSGPPGPAGPPGTTGPDEVRIQTGAPTIAAGEPELWVDTSVPTTPQLKFWDGDSWELVSSSGSSLGDFYYGVGTTTGNPPANTYTAINFVVALSSGMTGGAPNITVPRAGKYRVVAQVSGYANANGGSILTARIQQYSALSALKVTRTTQNPLPNFAGGWTQADIEGVFDCAAGDIFQIAVQPNAVMNLSTADCNVAVTPIGGVKGDPGIPGDLASANFWYGAPSGVTSAGGNAVPTSGAQIYWGPAIRSAGWTRHANTSAIVCDVAGRYKVHVNLSLVHITGASAYEILEIRKYPVIGSVETATFVGPGTNLAWYTQPQGSAVFDMLPGDLITVFVTPNQAAQVDGRASLVITPVGGAKGDTGTQGPQGTSGTVMDGVRRRHSANQTVPNSAATALQLDTLVDSLGSQTWAYNTTTRAITIPTDGLYLVSGQAQAENQQWLATQIYGALRVNTVDVALVYPSGSSYDVVAPMSALQLKAGDTVQLILGNFSGVTQTIRGQASAAGAPISPMLSIWRIGAGPKGEQGIQGIQGMPGNSVGTTAWTALTLASGWTNFAGGFATAAWRMAGDEVQLRGLIQRTPATVGQFTIATFAAAQRPPLRLLFAAPMSSGMARVDIHADGTLQLVGATQGTTGDLAYLSLDAIRWSTVSVGGSP